MYYDAFSRNVNKVIEYATALAKRFGCRYIGSEHVLFGLLNVTDGRAAAILRDISNCVCRMRSTWRMRYRMSRVL